MFSSTYLIFHFWHSLFSMRRTGVGFVWQVFCFITSIKQNRKQDLETQNNNGSR
jgi:hypothetical protein